MTEQEAIATVQRERIDLEIDPEMGIISAEKAIVEYVQDRSSPSVSQDRTAWIVSLASQWGLTAVHVDDGTGEVLEVLRSA